MAQTVTFYVCNDDPRRIDKQLNPIGNGLTKDYNLTRDCSLLRPIFVTSYDSNVFTANYCHIGEPFSKYYYITNINLIPGGKMEVICEIDPLMSYPNLVNCQCTILRAENPKHGKQLYDSKYPLVPKMELSTQYFPKTPFSTEEGYNYLLTVMGQEGTTVPNAQP